MRLRLNPAYDLREISHLDAAYVSKLEKLADLSLYYACLLPKEQGSALTIKLIDRETWSFINRHAVDPDEDHASNDAVSRLIFDRIIEVEREGRYYSGLEAFNFAQSDSVGDAGDGSSSLLNELSRKALHYAAHLDMTDTMSLSARLYFYNRRPYAPDLSNRYGDDPDSGLKAVGIEAAIERQGAPSSWETRRLPDFYDVVWKAWRRVGKAAVRSGKYKLYISVFFEDLHPVMDDIMAVVLRSDARQFKIGRRIQDLLRPDHFVVYFNDMATLLEAAEKLSSILRNARPHGVPFTGACTESGALSWGIDPVKEGEISGAMSDDLSWRIWVTNRLAMYLLNARASGADTQSAQYFAIRRLEMEGVDVRQWCLENERIAQ